MRAMSQAAAEDVLTHAPVRLAYWRIAALDTLLDRAGGAPAGGERALPDDIRDLVVAYAARHDAELGRSCPADQSGRSERGPRCRFRAQGRVMLQLAELRRVPNWQDLDLPSRRATTKPPNADVADAADRERPLDILADRARRLMTISVGRRPSVRL